MEAAAFAKLHFNISGKLCNRKGLGNWYLHPLDPGADKGIRRDFLAFDKNKKPAGRFW